MERNAPIDVATQETAAFVAAALPPPARVIEVGCGEGHLAAELQRRGFTAIAIDADPASVAAARRLGVDARVGSWPDCEAEPADAVVFTRSLHHLHALDDSLAVARQRLPHGGPILAEDFAPEDVDEAAIAWFVAVLRSPQGRALLDRAAADSVAAQLMLAEHPFAVWQAERDQHHVHSIAAMTAAMARQTDDVTVAQVPYFYRYLIPAVPATREAADWIGQVLKEEWRCMRAGEIIGLGRRLLGTVR